MGSRTAGLRRLRRFWVAALCLGMAAGTVQPVAAASARDQLAEAIETTGGTRLLYTFGPGYPAPMLDGAGNWYESTDGGRLIVVKSATRTATARLLVDSHQGAQARCEHTPGTRTRDGLQQASETYPPPQAWEMLGRPRIALNANFFDVRRQEAGRWKQIGCTSPLGVYVDNTGGLGRANLAVTGTIPYAGKQALSNGDEIWTPLSTLVMPVRAAPYLVTPKGPRDFEPATAEINRLVNNGDRFVAVSGIKLLAPGDTGQLNDPGTPAPRTALAYHRDKDTLYLFHGGRYTPDQIQDFFRGLGTDIAILLDGGGSTALVLRRNAGITAAGAASPPGTCDNAEVVCEWDPRERGLPTWLGID